MALGAVWAHRLWDAATGMPRVPDLSGAAYDDPANELPSVSIIVPARNEEACVEAALRSILDLDYPRLEVIAIDDRSTDGTSAILDQLAGGCPTSARLSQMWEPSSTHIYSADVGHPRLKVLHVTQLPDGWLGKTHAMWQGAQHASGDWLLFTDADIFFRRDALRRAVACAEQTGADHFILFPTLDTRSFGEAMMYGFFQMMFAFAHRPWKVSDPKATDSLGVGAFNLIRRRVYEEIGTYRALRLAVLDDMDLGERVKSTGHRQRCAFGRGLIRLHWGHGVRGIIDNLTKNFFAILRYSLPRALGACALILFVNEMPFAGLLFAPGWARLGFGVALCSMGCMYVGMSRYSPISPLCLFAHPLSSALFVYTVLRSTASTLWNGGVTWRGTKYSLDDLRQHLALTEAGQQREPEA